MTVAIEPFVVAGAIGFLLGFERERHAWREGEAVTALGARTFTLIALSGALAAALGPAVSAIGLAVVGLVVVVGYWRTSEVHRGTTTEVAAVLAYLLGALARTDMAVAAGIAVAVALLLEQKERVRHLLRDVVSDVEVDDALRFVAMAVVVLPLLPDHPVDRWGVIVPHRVWLLVVVLAGIGWVGYVATRVLGPRRGLPVTGLAGGFVSGSATTAMMARTARDHPSTATPALSGAIAASAATCVQVLAITAFVDATVWRAMAPAIAAGGVLLVIEAVVVAWRSAGDTDGDADDGDGDEGSAGRRPLQFRASLLIAAVLTATLVVSAALTEQFGGGAAVLTAAVAGLADSHAASIGVVSLAADGAIGTGAAIAGVGAALAVNTVVKLVLAAVAGGRRFVVRLAVALALPVAVIGVGLWWAAISA